MQEERRIEKCIIHILSPRVLWEIVLGDSEPREAKQSCLLLFSLIIISMLTRELHILQTCVARGEICY